MPSDHCHIRVRLPRSFIARLTARAAAENTQVNALILRAVRADLYADPALGKRPQTRTLRKQAAPPTGNP